MKLRWFLVGASLVTAAFLALTMSVDAHQCASGTAGACGPCKEGETHQHADPTYSCQTTPGFEVAAVVAGLGVVAWMRRHARP